jgi:type I restriction enzyme, S subunit
VIGRKGKLGGAYYINEPFWPHDTSLWVKDFHGNDEKFTALFLKNLRLEKYDAATSVPTLNRNIIHPILVTIPEKTEQINIVNRLEAYEEVIQKEKLVLKKLYSIKQGLMHDLLTGTIRVPQHLQPDKAKVADTEKV